MTAAADRGARHARDGLVTGPFDRNGLESCAGCTRSVGVDVKRAASVRVMHETRAEGDGRARHVHLMHRRAATVHDVHGKLLRGAR